MDSGRTECVFCHATGADTKEDPWPIWMQKGLGIRAPRHQLDWVGPRQTFKDAQVIREWPGWNRIGGFCQKCNNEWMSRIEDKAKPILLSMLMGRKRVLTPVDQKRLAQWAYLKTLVFSVGTPHVKISDAEFHRFYKSRKPPHYSLILLSGARERQKGVLFRFDPVMLIHADGTLEVESFRGLFFMEHVVIQSSRMYPREREGLSREFRRSVRGLTPSSASGPRPRKSSLGHRLEYFHRRW